MKTEINFPIPGGVQQLIAELKTDALSPEQRRVLLVLGRLMHMAYESHDDAEVLANELDSVCDDLLANDFFGTEGQSDPRGDQRDSGCYTMDYVQGIDD